MGGGVPGVGFLRLWQSLALEDHGGNDLERLHPLVRLTPRDQLQNTPRPGSAGPPHKHVEGW